MPRKQNMTASASYGPRERHDRSLLDENKRRKMLRWIKKVIGIEEEEEGKRSSVNMDEVKSLSASFGLKASLYPVYPTGIQHVHVLIAGAGIGGLCLAQGLRKAGIPFTVFERDPTPNYRTQGYRLRINSSGYEALQSCLSSTDFEVFSTATGHFQPGLEYLDAVTGKPTSPTASFAHKNSTVENVFSADRAMLRTLLLSGLNDGEVHYGMSLKSFQTLPNGRVEVYFDNGKRMEGSILIGADGTTSRVRRQYIPRATTLLDTDCGAIYGKTPLTPELEAFFSSNRTTLVTSQYPKMALVLEPRCSSQVNWMDYEHMTPSSGDIPDLQNYMCWVLIARAEYFYHDQTTSAGDLFAMEPQEVAVLSRLMTCDWSPSIRAVFEHQAPEWCSFLRISTTSPNIKKWTPSPVTLLGDAVHTMAPAGIGCNTALQDAHMLVKYFDEYGAGVEAIAQYENVMRENGKKGIELSIEAGAQMYGLPPVKDMRPVVY